ncbi:hypothetical protein HBB16_09845 [Pseudonocardia sp. MCCB 268]|nr:hypothetical protein [Pseudonocardia cytotoxica]
MIIGRERPSSGTRLRRPHCVRLPGVPTDGDVSLRAAPACADGGSLTAARWCWHRACSRVATVNRDGIAVEVGGGSPGYLRASPPRPRANEVGRSGRRPLVLPLLPDMEALRGAAAGARPARAAVAPGPGAGVVRMARW